MRKIIFIIINSIIVFFLTVACSHQPDIDIYKTLGKSENHFIQLEGIETTSSAFDGKRDIKFRLMVEETPTEEEAAFLFNEILGSFEKYSNHQDLWKYYNGSFDIKNHDDGILYEATKYIDEEIKVVSK